MNDRLKRIRPYVVSVLIALAVGGLAAWLTRGAMMEDSMLRQPPLSPPPWLFPIVWSILYTLVGISAAIIWRKAPLQRDKALQPYGVQLFLNFWWPILFFLLDARLAAFVLLLLLIITVVRMIRRFYTISPAAALLNTPYLLWLLFAAYLNLGIYLLNRGI